MNLAAVKLVTRRFLAVALSTTEATPTEEDLRFVHVMRALRQWRTVGDEVVAEQPYRDALAKTLAEYPHLAEAPRSPDRVL